MNRTIIFLMAIISVAITSCQTSSQTAQTPDQPLSPSSTPASEAEIAEPTLAAELPTPDPDVSGPRPRYAYTHHRADGNRVVEGRGGLPQVNFVDIPLAGQPRWLVGAPVGGDTLWVVALADGQTQSYIVDGFDVTETTILPEMLGEIPPALRIDGESAELLLPPASGSGPTHPVILDETGSLAYTNTEGDLVLLDPDENETDRLDISAIPDGRILVDEESRLLLLTEPTTRYDHGVLGDNFEASGVALIETRPEAKVATSISIPPEQVVEGIAPIWADLNGDGQKEIIVTQSDADSGARIVVYDESGSQVAAGPAIGQGYRWRHQIAVAPFGPNGETELVDVLTPHIGGVVEFYQLVENELQIVAQVPGFTSHIIGTRNLDMAVGGDFDGDGQYELLLPSQDRSELGAIRRTGDGAEVAWTIATDGRVSTNLAVVPLDDGRLAVGVGREDGTLRLWIP